jgi:hypothetical protein
VGLTDEFVKQVLEVGVDMHKWVDTRVVVVLLLLAGGAYAAAGC